MPDQKTSEMVYSRPRMIRVWADGREKKFMDDYIYLSFYSVTGASIDVLVSFADEEEVYRKKRNDFGGGTSKGIDTEEIMHKLNQRINKSQEEYSKRGGKICNFR
jgi:hypothetical protein